MALVGSSFGVMAYVTDVKIIGFGLVLIIPLLFWLVVIPVLHWKHRYLGEKNTLWGALLLIETSGWMKIVYWFRHILPDWRRRGRYVDQP